MSELQSMEEAASTDDIEPQAGNQIATDNLVYSAVKELDGHSINITFDKENYRDSFQYTGLVVIFNQINFKYEENRDGAIKDANALKKSFENLHFKTYTHTNLKREQILGELKKLADINHSNYKCFISVIMTHGGRDGVLLASDVAFKDYEVWENFTGKKCPTLKSKPKWFIFQACKNIQNISRPAGYDIVSKESTKRVSEQDMLVSNSTIEGNKSWRNKDNGSFFIQHLCKNINSNGKTADVLTILTNTNNHVNNHDKKYSQVAAGISTLNKKFYLIEGKEEPPNLRYF